ncbi:MAG: flippase [Oscillospiraceae bacterium]|nr:flippase [Oscillospiraceae bacterium]
MTIKSFLQNKVAQNAGWLIGGKIAQMAVNFVVGLLTARYLGPAGYGLINYAAAYVTFFGAISGLGINSVILKELIDRPNERGMVLGSALLMRAISSVLSALMLFGAISLIDAGETITIVVVSLSGLSLVFQSAETLSYWFQAQLKSKVYAVSSLLAFLISSAYKVYLLATGKTVIYFAAVTSIDYLFLGVFLYLAYRMHKGERFRFSGEYAKQLLRKGIHFVLPAVMVCIYAQTDKMMLKQMLNETEVGYYATAVSICTVWCFVLTAIIDSVNPSIMQLYRTDYAAFEQRTRQLYAIMIYVCVLASLFYTALAKPLIRILYGEAYLPAAEPLRVITWYTAFSYLGVARGSWVVCENKQKYLVFIYFAAAASNVILNWLLIPMWGTVGAAVASLAAQVITILVVPLIIRPMRRNTVLMLQAAALRGVFKKL